MKAKRNKANRRTAAWKRSAIRANRSARAYKRHAFVTRRKYLAARRVARLWNRRAVAAIKRYREATMEMKIPKAWKNFKKLAHHRHAKPGKCGYYKPRGFKGSNWNVL